jgi:hypothetical protein
MTIGRPRVKFPYCSWGWRAHLAPAARELESCVIGTSSQPCSKDLCIRNAHYYVYCTDLTSSHQVLSVYTNTFLANAAFSRIPQTLSKPHERATAFS